ncbi:MAG: methionine synthase [Candidatus Zipacnadales bacterium]
MTRKRVVLGAALGNDVHVAGVLSFLRLAEEAGYVTEFLGPATPVGRVIAAAKECQPEILALSYRLSPEPLAALLRELKTSAAQAGLERQRMCFGGTPAVAEVARQSGLFEAIFTGLEPASAVAQYLRGAAGNEEREQYANTLVGRIEQTAPWPIIRHHFGQPSLEKTIEGARRLAEAGVLDVLSLAPDQNAQEFFFRPHKMRPELSGAGGAPFRKPEDLRAVYEATRCGNYPLVRCYSGTQDLLQWAEVHVETIHNAWAAVPLCWYNVLDGRSQRLLVDSFAETQAVMRWYAERGLPVESNEAHHWSLREAHDTIAVVMAYLGAYNAKAMGVQTYVAQYMFGSPATVSPAMDLAKMLAKVELIESLHDATFNSIRQTRAGLMSLSPDQDRAKGQLAGSTVLQLQLRPSIYHVVGFCEGNHAATVEDIVESCKIAQGAIHDWLRDVPDMTADPAIQDRKQELLEEAHVLLEAIRSLGDHTDDPLTSPTVIDKAVKIGLLDAPHLAGNPHACGCLRTACIHGAIRPIDPETHRPLSEKERVERVLAAVG